MTERVVLTGGEVFDGTGAPASRADVVLEGHTIVAVGHDLDGDTAIDLTGCTILPGFIDAHVHLTLSHVNPWQQLDAPFSYRFYQSVENLRATLEAGITTVRDASGADLGLKAAVDNALIPGPRVLIAVAMISQTGGHNDGWLASGQTAHPLFPRHPGIPDTVADGPSEIRRTVRQLVRAGADVIKVATSGGVLSPRDHPTSAHFRDEELTVLVEEANAAGLRVMAHAQATEGIKAAIRAGVRSIEHGIYLDDEAIDLMLEAGTYLVPTLVAPYGVLDAAESVGETIALKAKDVIEAHRDSFRRAVEAGVSVALGTDSGITPHGHNLRELGLMVDGGMTSEAALLAGTSNAARLLGLDHIVGTVQPGKRGDLTVVTGSTADARSVADRICLVIHDGAVVANTLVEATESRRPRL